IGVDILVSERNFRTQQHDQPTCLQPEQEQRQCGKTTIDRIGAGKPELQVEIESLKDLVNRSSRHSTNDSRDNVHPCVWNHDVDEGKEIPQNKKRQDFESQLNELTEHVQDLHLLGHVFHL